MTFKAPVALLRFDAITIRRPVANAGKTAVTYTTVYAGRGTLGAPTGSEFIYGPETDRVSVNDSSLALALGIDVKANDLVDTTRGTFTVVAVSQHRLHQRALLRIVG